MEYKLSVLLEKKPELLLRKLFIDEIIPLGGDEPINITERLITYSNFLSEGRQGTERDKYLCIIPTHIPDVISPNVSMYIDMLEECLFASNIALYPANDQFIKQDDPTCWAYNLAAFSHRRVPIIHHCFEDSAMHNYLKEHGKKIYDNLYADSSIIWNIQSRSQYPSIVKQIDEHDKILLESQNKKKIKLLDDERALDITDQAKQITKFFMRTKDC